MSRPMSKVPAVLLGLILLLLAATAYMSSRLNRILEDNPAIAECLQRGGSAEECRSAQPQPDSQAASAASAAPVPTP